MQSNRTSFDSALRTSTFRLALAYCLLFTIGVGFLLGTIYLFTERALANGVDNVILIELDALADEYDRDGMSGVIAELNRLHESWAREGAIYLLADRDFRKLAGNLEAWPFTGVPPATWPEFEIKGRSETGTSTHPARARVFILPDGYLLVGTDVSDRRSFQRRFRAATDLPPGSARTPQTPLGCAPAAGG